MIVRSVVVLPAPLRPTRQTTSRGPTSSETRRKIWLASMNTSTSATLSTPSRRLRSAADHDVHHLLIAPDLGRRRVGDDPALVERHDAVGVAEDDVHVVLDLDDGLEAHPPRRPDQDLHDGRLVARAHPAGRLVEQDDLGAQ